MAFFSRLKKMMSPLPTSRVVKEEDFGKVEPGEKVRGRPKVHVLATGGTIAGRLVSTGPRYRSGVLGVEALMDAVPALRGLADYSSEQVANIGSQDMDEFLWLKLSRRVKELLGSPDVDGVVITHGTDTLEETAFFLDLTVRNSRKPVVLVGAVRPAGALGADGAVNLLDAITVATDPGSARYGVLVVMHGSLFEARDVTKVSSSALPAFAAPNSGPLGQLVDGRIYWQRAGLSLERLVFDVSRLDKLPPVGIVYGHAGVSTIPVKALIEAGYKGIVSAGVGSGNLPHDVLDVLASASGRGVAVVRASRVPSGLTLRNVEMDDNRYGFIAAGALNPQKAKVLLQLALTKVRKPEEIQKVFDTY